MLIEQEQLFHENLEWSAKLAKNVHVKIPPSFDLADLEQVASIELWRQAQKYDPSKHTHGTKVQSFQGFAYQAVRGAVLMSIRRRAWKEATHAPLLACSLTRVDPQLRPDEQVDAGRQHRADCAQRSELLKLIRKLPTEHAYLVRRVYLNEVSEDELARTWGISRQMVGRHLAVAVRALRKAAVGAPPAERSCKSGWLFLGSMSHA